MVTQRSTFVWVNFAATRNTRPTPETLTSNPRQPIATPHDESEGFQKNPRRPRASQDEGVTDNPLRPARQAENDGDDRDRPRRPRRPRSADDNRDDGYGRNESAVSTLIPYKNGLALTAYYLGVFGLIPALGLILGPLALIFGIIGLKNARRNPQVKGTGHAITGITLGAIAIALNWGLVLLMVIGALSHR